MDIVGPLQRGPQPGDAVRLDRPYVGEKPGQIGIIDSIHFEQGQEGLVVFRASAFRGPPSFQGLLELRVGGGQLTAQREEVSCSGGPCPFVKFKDLTLTGEHEATFWKWNQYGPGAGHGENYKMTVPLWSWQERTTE